MCNEFSEWSWKLRAAERCVQLLAQLWNLQIALLEPPPVVGL